MHLNFKYSEFVIKNFINEFNLMSKNKIIVNINDYLRKKNIIYESEDKETTQNTMLNKQRCNIIIT